MVKIAIIGMMATVLAIMMGEKKEYTMFISITCCVLIFFFILDKLIVVIDILKEFNNYIGMDVAYLKLLLKMIGIMYISEISIGICRDVGYVVISKYIEIVIFFHC